MMMKGKAGGNGSGVAGMAGKGAGAGGWLWPKICTNSPTESSKRWIKNTIRNLVGSASARIMLSKLIIRFILWIYCVKNYSAYFFQFKLNNQLEFRKYV